MKYLSKSYQKNIWQKRTLFSTFATGGARGATTMQKLAIVTTSIGFMTHLKDQSQSVRFPSFTTEDQKKLKKILLRTFICNCFSASLP